MPLIHFVLCHLEGIRGVNSRTFGKVEGTLVIPVRAPRLHRYLANFVAVSDMMEDLSSAALFAVPVLSIILWNQTRHKKKNDAYYLQQAQQLRLVLDKPLHSRFRVVALLLLEDGTTVLGTNDERSPSIGGAICAERAAFLSLKVRDPSNQHMIDTIYIVSDADNPVPPGMLCREYMTGHSAVTSIDTTRIVLQSAQVDSEPWIVTLRELYPYPSLYNRLSVEEQLRIGKEWDLDLEREIVDLDVPGMNHAQVMQLLRAARQATEQDDHDSLHPIRYGAAVAIQSEDDKNDTIVEIQSAAQRKALEYGCSLDAVCQLACYLVVDQKALCIVQVDQYGIVHAPFAPARSFLVEHGFADCPCLVMSRQEDGPTVQAVLAESLAPYIPKFR